MLDTRFDLSICERDERLLGQHYYLGHGTSFSFSSSIQAKVHIACALQPLYLPCSSTLLCISYCSMLQAACVVDDLLVTGNQILD